MDNRAVLEAGCASCSDTGSASIAAHFWSKQMGELSHWTEETLLSRALIRWSSPEVWGYQLSSFFSIQHNVFKLDLT